MSNGSALNEVREGDQDRAPTAPCDDVAIPYCDVQVPGSEGHLRVYIPDGFERTTVRRLRESVLLEALAKRALPPNAARVVDATASSSHASFSSAPAADESNDAGDPSASLTHLHEAARVGEQIKLRLMYQGGELTRDSAALTHYHLRESGRVLQAHFSVVNQPRSLASVSLPIVNEDDVRAVTHTIGHALRNAYVAGAGGAPPAPREGDGADGSGASAPPSAAAGTQHLTNQQVLQLLYEEQRHRRAQHATAANAAASADTAVEVQPEAGEENREGLADVAIGPEAMLGDDDDDDDVEEELGGEDLMEAQRYAVAYGFVVGGLFGPAGMLVVRSPSEVMGMALGIFMFIAVLLVSLLDDTAIL